MVFWLTYKTEAGNREVKIEAESEKEAETKAKEAAERIIEEDKTACGFELNRYTITLGERVEPKEGYLNI